MYKWQLKKTALKRFGNGHPWVFSNELTKSPKGTPKGELVELWSEDGQFLAVGYGNPNSLIAFRELSRVLAIINTEFFLTRFLEASNRRRTFGLSNSSHRLIFAEGDELPGLIIDRYLTPDKKQLFVVQSSTAGMDALEQLWLAALEQFVFHEHSTYNTSSWDNTAVVTAHTSSSRTLEGLEKQSRQVIKTAEVDLNNFSALIQSGIDTNQNLVMNFDVLNGQKTGFFLDQRWNIRLTLPFLTPFIEKKSIRVLDICSYVGHWSTQIAMWGAQNKVEVEAHLVDASEDALKFAATNVSRYNGRPATFKADVLRGLHHLPDGAFDIVICDPPALIKKKKDIPAGSQAYLKLNKEARKKTCTNGIYVSCSCSGLFEEAEFKNMLARVSHSNHTRIQWLAQGFHSPDHPQRLEFREGTYLKSMIGINLKVDSL